MKRLRFVVKGKDFINFNDVTINNLLRQENNERLVNVSYTGGTGYNIANNTVLYTQGTLGTDGYLHITVNGTQTLTGSGNLAIRVVSKPTHNQANESKNITIDGSDFVIYLGYNTTPVIEDIEIEVDNRTPRVLTMADFNAHFTDYDGEPIGSIILENTDSNLEFNGVPYVSGTPITVVEVNNGLLIYNPDDTDIEYNDDYDYEVTDASGNYSN